MLAKDCRGTSPAQVRGPERSLPCGGCEPNGRAIRRRGIRRIYNLEVTTSEVTFDLWPGPRGATGVDRRPQWRSPAVVAVGEPSDGPRPGRERARVRVALPLPPPSRVRHDCRELRLRDGTSRPGSAACSSRLVRRPPSTGSCHHRPHRGRERGLDRAAPLVRFRACRRRARGGPQAPQVARRGRAPATALRRSGSGEGARATSSSKHPSPASRSHRSALDSGERARRTRGGTRGPRHQQRVSVDEADRSTLPPGRR